MVQQSKLTHDELEQCRTQISNLNLKLKETQTANENLLDTLQEIIKTTMFYKDEEVMKTCRKQVSEIDPKQNSSLNYQISRFTSFMRMYHPVDLVGPLKKEIDQL